MLSKTGYQLYDTWTFEYTGTEVYNGKEYFKYLSSEVMYILAPTRNITKVTFPFDDYYIYPGNKIIPFSEEGYDSLYGFTSVPENKILMKPRTDIGTNANGKDYVNLGLTSGTLWAKCNVGATSETGYGSYFQWGDTEDKRNAECIWASYKYGDGSNFSKYNTGINGYGGTIGGTIDNKTTLDLEDDAARANMGGDWKIPSVALMEELKEETTSEWITDYNGTGVSGREFTSKKNGNSIFIPAAGQRSGSSFRDRGKYGYVWSSSLNTGYSQYDLCLRINSTNVIANNNGYRNRGYVVRGVL